MSFLCSSIQPGCTNFCFIYCGGQFYCRGLQGFELGIAKKIPTYHKLSLMILHKCMSHLHFFYSESWSEKLGIHSGQSPSSRQHSPSFHDTCLQHSFGYFVNSYSIIIFFSIDYFLVFFINILQIIQKCIQLITLKNIHVLW